jgi:hypothetical protein
MHEDGTDRDAALGKALPGLVKCRLEKLIHE